MAIVQHRRGSGSELVHLNPLLAAGEIVVDTDCLRFKIGDGVSNWNDLRYNDEILVILIQLLASRGVISSTDASDILDICRCPGSTGAYGTPSGGGNFQQSHAGNDGDGGLI